MQKRRTWFFKRRELSEYTQQVFLSTHPNQYKHNITQWKNYLKEQTVINLKGSIYLQIIEKKIGFLLIPF